MFDSNAHTLEIPSIKFNRFNRFPFLFAQTVLALRKLVRYVHVSWLTESEIHFLKGLGLGNVGQTHRQ